MNQGPTGFIGLNLLWLRREMTLSDPKMASGYLVALEICAGICRSHTISAERKFGHKSEGARIGRADLCCIEREIRRVRKLETQETA